MKLPLTKITIIPETVEVFDKIETIGNGHLISLIPHLYGAFALKNTHHVLTGPIIHEAIYEHASPEYRFAITEARRIGFSFNDESSPMLDLVSVQTSFLESACFIVFAGKVKLWTVDYNWQSYVAPYLERGMWVFDAIKVAAAIARMGVPPPRSRRLIGFDYAEPYDHLIVKRTDS